MYSLDAFGVVRITTSNFTATAWAFPSVHILGNVFHPRDSITGALVGDKGRATCYMVSAVKHGSEGATCAPAISDLRIKQLDTAGSLICGIFASQGCLATAAVLGLPHHTAPSIY